MGRFRGEEGRVPILPHPAPPGIQSNGKNENVHTRGRPVAAPSGTALCIENKFFWYQLKFGRKWLLGGRKLDSAHISPGRGAGEQLSGVKQSNREVGPLHTIPDRAEGTAHPSWLFEMMGGEGGGLVKKNCHPSSSYWAPDTTQNSSSTSHYPHLADVQTETLGVSDLPEVTKTRGKGRERNL